MRFHFDIENPLLNWALWILAVAFLVLGAFWLMWLVVRACAKAVKGDASTHSRALRLAGALALTLPLYGGLAGVLVWLAVKNTFYEGVQSVYFGPASLTLEYRFSHRDRSIAYDEIQHVRILDDLPPIAHITGNRSSRRKLLWMEIGTTRGTVIIDAGNDSGRIRALKKVHSELLGRFSNPHPGANERCMLNR